MRHSTTFLALLFASLTAATTACKQVECADGTIERDGECVPADFNPDPTKCGPFTELQGDQCVPIFPPTQCEDGTTDAVPDNDTGVITCKGTGGTLPCGVPLSCSPAATGKLTICGQIYDFADSTEFRATTGADGTPCDKANPTTSGPCALQVVAFDAIQFASSPTSATPLPADLTIDTCGRFKLKDIDISSSTSPYIGLGFDDAKMPFGPAGVTVTVGVTTTKPGERVLSGVEGFMLKPATIAMWGAGGFTTFGTTGAYAPIFRKHIAGGPMPFEPQAGVTVTKNTLTTPANDFYFSDTDPNSRTMIDGSATATGANGSVLYNAASVMDLNGMNAVGGLGPGCRWEGHTGASLQGLLFVQVFRKINAVSGTCND